MKEYFMPINTRALREPEERVGRCSNAALPPPAVDVDDLLVRGIRARDEAALTQLYDRYSAALLHMALQFVHRTEEAEEVVQETWMAVLAGIDRFEGRSAFKTWLFRILINRARTRAKREARAIPFSALSAADQVRVEDANTSHVAVPDTELGDVIERGIRALSRTQRIVLSLRDIEGWSAQEVCDALDLSPVNQRVALHRARMNMREYLSPYLD
jgi:RNA polymerase sigma-70 factor (ECF subfamily)